MTLNDLLGALTGDEKDNQGKPTDEKDALSGLIGNLMGGQTDNNEDQLSKLLGGLLGGAGQQQTGGQNTALGNAIGILEGLLGSGSSATAANTNDPMMQMLTPVVDGLAKKMKISPQVAMVVVSFAAHQLLSNHPASGRAGSLNINALREEISSSGGISHNFLQSSGLVSQLAKQTGMDEETAVKSLKTVFDLLGKRL